MFTFSNIFDILYTGKKYIPRKIFIRMNKINLSIIGGLGDVSLTRKIPQIYSTDLNEKITISSIADIYPESQVNSPTGLEELFDEIIKRRLKGKVNPEEINKLKQELLDNKIRYFQSQNNDLFFSDFFQHIDNLPNPAIDISTPNKYHLDLFKRIAEQTKANILVEKPFVCSQEQLIQSKKFFESRKDPTKRIMMDVEHYSYYNVLSEYLENLPSYLDKYGKIKSMLLILTETEGFESQRNKDIINISKSGGGVWLDLGIHPVSFMSLTGAKISRGTIIKEAKKAEIPEISGNEYGETEMIAEFKIEGEHFMDNAKTKIHVGKAMKQKRKNFYIEHERGILDLNVLEKRARAYSQAGDKINEKYYQDDAFYNVLNHFAQSVQKGTTPRTPIIKSLSSLDSLFQVYAA